MKSSVTYRQSSNTRGTNSHHLNVSRLVSPKFILNSYLMTSRLTCKIFLTFCTERALIWPYFGQNLKTIEQLKLMLWTRFRKTGLKKSFGEIFLIEKILGSTSIRHRSDTFVFCVWSISNRCRSEDLWYMEFNVARAPRILNRRATDVWNFLSCVSVHMMILTFLVLGTCNISAL